MTMTTASLITPFRPGDRVLVACGDHALAEALARTFGTAGFTVRIAFDGVAALDKARAFFPTAAVLGLDLRYLDGVGLARALRTIPGCARMRVLALLPPALGLLDRHRCFDYVLRTPRAGHGARPVWVVDTGSLGIRPTLVT
jgi:CheY-like chemotaxis protein